jgi:hypothetical protein
MARVSLSLGIIGGELPPTVLAHELSCPDLYAAVVGEIGQCAALVPSKTYEAKGDL